MELLCASLLAHFNGAERVVSLCCSDGGTPYNFAPAGLPDLTAEYAPSVLIKTSIKSGKGVDIDFSPVTV